MKKLSTNSKKTSLFTIRRLQVFWFTLYLASRHPPNLATTLYAYAIATKNQHPDKKNIYMSSKKLSLFTARRLHVYWFTLQPASLYLPNLASALPAYAIAAKNQHLDEENFNKLKEVFHVYNKEDTVMLIQPIDKE